uniref:Uncharacterized protein n=1 Tax=Arundo donax TaxID=35708 RepID=A0A0A9DWM7_ARUDO
MPHFVSNHLVGVILYASLFHVAKKRTGTSYMDVMQTIRQGTLIWHSVYTCRSWPTRIWASGLKCNNLFCHNFLRTVSKKIKVMEDEMDSQKDDLSLEYNPGSERENNNPWFAPDSPSTKERKIENTRKAHMAKASHALKYHHTKHAGDDYTPGTCACQSQTCHFHDRQNRLLHPYELHS